MQQTRFFAESLKHLIGTCPLEPRDIPAFFEHVEKIFRNYHVDGEIKANLLIMSLNEKAKTWLHTISADGLKDYSEIKRLILQEFRLNSTKLRDEFFALRRQKSESYTSFGAKLYGTLNHYFQSRNITGLEDAMKLICADRMKELLSRHTLEFILSQEQAASWMSPDVLAQTIDKYETAMNMKVSSDNTCMPESINQIQSFRENEHQMYRSSNNKSASPKQTCFSCGKIGHIAKHCTWKNRITPTATRKVMRCETDKKTQRPVEIESPIRTKEVVIEANKLYDRKYIEVNINDEIDQKALIDSGSEICCISEEISYQLKLQPVDTIAIKGIGQHFDHTKGVWIQIKPTWLLLTPSVVDLIEEMKFYDVPIPQTNLSEIDESMKLQKMQDSASKRNELTCDNPVVDKTEQVNPVTVEVKLVEREIGKSVNEAKVKRQDPMSDVEESTDEDQEVDKPDLEETGSRDSAVAEKSTLLEEQLACESLKRCWEYAKTGKHNFFIEEGVGGM
ncbi:hypothetical protein HELRODRAFT_165967 [Helobdella robusta]|uniref:CCHC-type domain-containing protein n=1 Tax=Helobdella robusta TaxID=6412 RepID=T1EXI5_HELRO|nr:hypothetical protein HELRODRAFT_165967 [Helobdella robusta]ESN90314.1 hypothetical protein HELRODRAFT_165967 [Helobdella robusta]